MSAPRLHKRSKSHRDGFHRLTNGLTLMESGKRRVQSTSVSKMSHKPSGCVYIFAKTRLTVVAERRDNRDTTEWTDS